MLRIGMLTSGGDCQALNATMRGVVRGIKTLITDEFEVYDFIDGYKGMVYGNYRKMKYNDFTGILNKGGTILGTSRMPFKEIDIPTADGIDKVKAMKETYKKIFDKDMKVFACTFLAVLTSSGNPITERMEVSFSVMMN